MGTCTFAQLYICPVLSTNMLTMLCTVVFRTAVSLVFSSTRGSSRITNKYKRYWLLLLEKLGKSSRMNESPELVEQEGIEYDP